MTTYSQAAAAVENVADDAARQAAVTTAAAVVATVAAEREASAATVTAAQTAVALADATAAAAELDAAERTRALIAGLEQWQTATTAELARLAAIITALETSLPAMIQSSAKEQLLLILPASGTGETAPTIATVDPASGEVAVVESPAVKTKGGPIFL